MTRSISPIWVSPFPPLASGIAQYSADFLGAVCGTWSLSILPEPGSDASRIGHVVVDLDAARARDTRIIQIGNSHFHERAFNLASTGGGILVLHDVVLHHARLADFVRRGRTRDYIALMGELYGVPGEAHARSVLRGAKLDADRYPLSEDIVRKADVVAVHSQDARCRVLEIVPNATVRVIPMGVPLPAMIDRADARSHLGIPDETLLITSITHVNPMKRIPVVLRAFRRLVEKVPHARLVVAGSIADGMRIDRHVEYLGLGSHVTLTGYISDDHARILARASDVSVNLRYPSTGETSASLLRLMAAGVPVIVTRHGSAMEIPEGAALHVPVDRLEEETLAEYLYWLSRDSEARAAIGTEGRAFVAENHSMANMVDGYREVAREAWSLELPGIGPSLVEEPAPRLDRVVGESTVDVEAISPVREAVATSLVTLGLGGHGGTIEEIARSMVDLGLDIESGAFELAKIDNHAVDPSLLEILACPVCKVSVRLQDGKLVCEKCEREYDIENGIPIMLVEDDQTA